ncbi:MAG: aldehyde dehydrogenase EutE [Myxococcales bacterium]|nr:aldehyde dehydrogenase EutE [Myxococcales bacterium]
MAVSVNEKELDRLVALVAARVQEELSARSGGRPAAMLAPAVDAGAAADARPQDGIFADMEQAIEAARQSYAAFEEVSLARRKVFVEAMRECAVQNAEAWARLAVEETGLGRVEHKIQKNLLAARKTPGVEDLVPLCYTGDDGMTLVEPAPFGVIGAITPCTNPAATIINNSLSIVSAGNAVVFNPHPSARRVSNAAVAALNGAIRRAGGPDRLLCSLARPSMESSQALMKHPAVRLLLVTGGGEVVKLALASGKRCVAAGPGNPPVIVDDTADVKKAARCIVDGASFDNNVLCTAEKEVFVFESMADALKQEMQRYGAFELRGGQIEAAVKTLVEPGTPYPHPHKKFVGKDAAILAQAIGVSVPPETRLLIAEVGELAHPLIQAEMLMPILPIMRVRDLDQALECARAAEHGFRHSAMMHSESVSNMTRVAREVECTIFVKNAPSYAGLGYGGEGYATLSIAGPTGEGLTSARTFTRQRRCVLAGGFRII